MTTQKDNAMDVMQDFFPNGGRDWDHICALYDAKVSIRKLRVDDNSAWNTGRRHAGITDFRFHDLRHTWASWLVQTGVPLSALQEIGGWESIEMVQRYAHPSPSHLTEHARKIDEVLASDVTNLALLESVAI